MAHGLIIWLAHYCFPFFFSTFFFSKKASPSSLPILFVVVIIKAAKNWGWQKKKKSPALHFKARFFRQWQVGGWHCFLYCTFPHLFFFKTEGNSGISWWSPIPRLSLQAQTRRHAAQQGAQEASDRRQGLKSRALWITTAHHHKRLGSEGGLSLRGSREAAATSGPQVAVQAAPLSDHPRRP